MTFDDLIALSVAGANFEHHNGDIVHRPTLMKQKSGEIFINGKPYSEYVGYYELLDTEYKRSLSVLKDAI